MKVLTTAIQKGGAGKTTTAAAIAQAATKNGLQVLGIDLDPQGNFTMISGATTKHGSSYDLITGADPAQLIQKAAAGYDMITAARSLSALDTAPGSARRLQKALAPIISKYDLIVIDTPPTPGELQYNALQAADALIIPLEADPQSIQGLYQITDTARQIQRTNPQLSIKGVVITRYDARSSFNKAMRDIAEQTAANLSVPYLGEIRQGAKIKEAQGLRLNIYEYAPKCKPAADYMALYEKLN